MELDYNFSELFPNAPKNLAEAKAKLVSVLDRGIYRHRLDVALPQEIAGQWVKNDPTEISRMEELGFIVDTKFAVANVVNSTAGRPIVDDVIHMIAPAYVQEAIDKHRNELYVKTHGRKNEKAALATAAAREFAQTNEFGTIDESETAAITGEDIARVLTKKE